MDAANQGLPGMLWAVRWEEITKPKKITMFKPTFADPGAKTAEPYKAPKIDSGPKKREEPKPKTDDRYRYPELSVSDFVGTYTTSEKSAPERTYTHTFNADGSLTVEASYGTVWNYSWSFDRINGLQTPTYYKVKLEEDGHWYLEEGCPDVSRLKMVK